MKLFHTGNIDPVKECRMFFYFEMPSTLLSIFVLIFMLLSLSAFVRFLLKKLLTCLKRVENFQKQYQKHQNTGCQTVNNLKPS